MTPRERAPQVWAAVYACAYDRNFAAAYSGADGNPDERTDAAVSSFDEHVVRRTVKQADAAVIALESIHGGPLRGPFEWTVRLDAYADVVKFNAAAMEPAK